MTTIEDVLAYARKHYNEGGDVIVECWEEKDIQKMLDEGYGLDYFQCLMGVWEDEEKSAMYPDGIPERADAAADLSGDTEPAESKKSCSTCRFRFYRSWGGWESCLDYEMATSEAECEKAAKDCPKYEEGNPDGWGEEEYTPSASAGDYGPSNPWDAPGMSIRDFI